MATVWDLYDSFCSGEQGGALPAADPRAAKPGCPEGAVVAQGEPEKTPSLVNTSSLGRICWVMI